MAADEFLRNFHHVATIGATANNGVHRLAASAEDGQVRTWFSKWIEDAGYTLHVDGIGNMFGLIEWTPGAAYILIGSHLDSQPRGGRFDGAYGVIAALHAAKYVEKCVKISGQYPKFNLAVANWFNEEGGRFAPSIMGSSVYAGLFDKDKMLDTTDLQGITVREALTNIGALGTDKAPIAAGYAEIHIEQGRILEREDVDIGLVDSSWHTQKFDIEVLGEQSHTGATAMADRHDALVAAAKIVLMVRDITNDFPEGTLVSSVGQHVVEPNFPIVVARRVHMVADLRSNDPQKVEAAREKLTYQIHNLTQEHDITINVKDFDVRPIRHYSEAGVALSERLAEQLGLSSRRIQTMAGHDSVAMNAVVPAVMLFIPSVDGVSHCEREFTTDDAMVHGVDLLGAVALELVNGALGDSVLHG